MKTAYLIARETLAAQMYLAYATTHTLTTVANFNWDETTEEIRTVYRARATTMLFEIGVTPETVAAEELAPIREAVDTLARTVGAAPCD